MMLLTIILLLSVANGDAYPSGHFQYYLEDETPEVTSLRDLRGTDTRSTAGSPSPKFSMLFSMGAGPQRNTWWWSPERPYSKRRQNVAYYNLNSFGLRYGKREQNMPVNEYLHQLMYGIICFLAAVVLILLILLFKMFISMQSETLSTQPATRENQPLCVSNALSVSPTSGDGADNTSSTSSGTQEGSLSDLSTSSQRYVSLEDRRKTSDYINVSETASLGLVDFKKTDIDYVNFKESQQKKVKRKGQVSCRYDKF